VSATADLERISYAAVTAEWPGRNGPRNFRILCTLLKRQREMGSLTLVARVGLRELSVWAGLSDNAKQSKAALADLEKGGWLAHLPATCQVYLLVPTTAAQYPIASLPDPTVTPFENPNGSQSGSKEYLRIARLHFTSPDEDTELYLDREYFGDNAYRDRRVKFEASRDGYKASQRKTHKATRGIGDWIEAGAMRVLADAPSSVVD